MSEFETVMHQKKHRVAQNASQFLTNLRQTQNFLLAPELFSFEMNMPPVEDVIDILRRDEETRVRSPGEKIKDQEGEFTRWVRNAPIEEVIEKGKFALSNFELNRFYEPNQFLHEFQDRIMIPWRTFLSRQGYTWQRCAPYIFISMSGISSTFHADYSHVLAWQIYGEKIFNGFFNPEKYAPIEDIVIKGNAPRSVEVPIHDPSDVLSYKMEPGDVLWNQLLTPHWVLAGVGGPAFSINISHGGVRHRGMFLANERLLRERWQAYPDEAWIDDLRY